AHTQPPAAPQPATSPTQSIQPPTTARPTEQPPTPTAQPSAPAVLAVPVAPLPIAPIAPTVQTVPAAPAAPTSTPARTDCPGCPDAVHAYRIAFWVISGLLFVTLLGILVSLRNSPEWSLAGALSEKYVIQRTMEQKTETKPEVVTGSSAKAQTETKPEVVVGSSASRLIATLGTLVLTTTMLGVGYAMIWSLFVRGQIPALDGIGP